MGNRLSVSYDAEGDILYLDLVEPHMNQSSNEIAAGIVVRYNSDDGRIESFEVQGLSLRAFVEEPLVLPILAEFSALVPEVARS